MSDTRDFKFASKSNSVDALYEDDGMMVVSIDLMHEDESVEECNNNMCNISHESIEVSVPTIYNKSISCLYNSTCKDFVTGIKEHFYDEEQRFQTHIIGHIPSDARVKFVERPNGKTYLNVEAVIDKYIEPQIVKILKDNGGSIKVSVVFSAQGKQNEENGIFYVDSFILRTVTLLSDEVKEGIEGSHLEVMKFSEQRANELDSKYSRFAYNKPICDIYAEIKNKKNIKKEETLVMVEKDITNSLGVHELERRLWGKLKDYTYRDGSWEGRRYWIYEILTDSKEVIVHDNQTDEYYKIPYKVNKEGDVTIKEEDRKKVVEDKDYREVNNALSFAKEDMGKGQKIEIDKSKDAISDTAWGKVNKVDLRNKVMDASNKDALVKAVYLVVEDGWEDAPSEKLKYPVMEIKGGKAVYNRFGLASALAYAKANDEDDVVGKVMKLYKELGIEDKEVENKLDKHNPEIEKIKDDADAREDDEKEKLQKEKKNSEVDKPEEEDLEDDIDADEDYWKKKHDEMKNKCDEWEAKYCELEKEVKVYRRNADKEAMKAYMDTYKRAIPDDEYEILATNIETMDKCEFEKEVDKKVKAFVEKMSKVDTDKVIVNATSNSSISIMNRYDSTYSVPKLNNIDDVLTKLKQQK